MLAGAALAGVPQTASAAGGTAVGQASAVIVGGIAVRGGASWQSGPNIQIASFSQAPMQRSVIRQCRPGDSQSSDRCRMLLLEMQ